MINDNKYYFIQLLYIQFFNYTFSIMETTLRKYSNNYMTLHNFSLQLQSNEENFAARLRESGIGKVSFQNIYYFI